MHEKQLVKFTFGSIFTESVIKKSTGILSGKKVKCSLFFRRYLQAETVKKG